MNLMRAAGWLACHAPVNPVTCASEGHIMHHVCTLNGCHSVSRSTKESSELSP